MSLLWRRTRAEVSRACSDNDSPLPLVAIKVTGGVGDLVVAARYVRDLAAHVEPMHFDLYCSNPATASWYLPRFRGLQKVSSEFLFDHLRGEYPLALWTCQYVIYFVETVDWKRLRGYPRLAATLGAIEKSRRPIEPLIANHPYLDNHLGQMAAFSNFKRFNFLHSMSGVTYGGHSLPLKTAGDEVLRRHGLVGAGWLTIHNGFDPQFFVSSSKATKCYDQFDEVVRLLKVERPDSQDRPNRDFGN